MQNERYKDFKQDLAKEQDVTAQAHLTAFYNMFLGDYEGNSIDYNSPYGQYLQSAGVDKVFVLYNDYGNIHKQIWIQEKVCSKNYDSMLFEYQKSSGVDGWAISHEEKADFLVYYQDGEISVMKTADVRAWLRENLGQYKRRFYFKSDNHNVIVPKYLVKSNINVFTYQLSDYYNEEGI